MTRKNKSFASRLSDWLSSGSDRLEKEFEDDLSESIGSEEPSALLSAPGESQLYEKFVSVTGTKGTKFAKGLYASLAIVVCLAIIFIMLWVVLGFPQFGDADMPAENEVISFYAEHTMEETGAVNIVTGIILDYRGFDTLGESHVLFIAVSTVILLLRLRQDDPQAKLKAEADDRHFEPKNDAILQVGASILVPVILLFGIYVLLNGHLSPGGGFSGGSVIGAGLILYLNAFGFLKTERFFTFRTFKIISYCALTFYSLAKGYFFFMSANDWESGISAGTVGNIFSAGLLLPLSIVVGCVVACTMFVLYTLFRKGDV